MPARSCRLIMRQCFEQVRFAAVALHVGLSASASKHDFRLVCVGRKTIKRAKVPQVTKIALALYSRSQTLHVDVVR